jgi:cysteine desulfurase/selenocysteine lyase
MSAAGAFEAAAFAPSIDAIRRDFPILNRLIDGKPLIYMDSAATSLKPVQVANAVLESYNHCTSNIHRGRHLLSEEASDRYEEARYKIAMAMGCSADEVLFVRNTTEGLNVAAEFLRLGPDDLVVGFLDSHHSQMLPWRRRSRFEMVGVGADGLPDLDQLQTLLKQRPKAVVVTHCSNVSGAYAPVDEIVALARAAGALVILDAAQSAPHVPIDFRSLDVDFLAFSSHKMLGPSGIGCLIGRSELLRDEAPVYIGGGTVDEVRADGWTLRRSPHRHEAGTPAIEGAIGLGAAIDYLEGLGFDAIAAHERCLSNALVQELNRRPRFRMIGPADADKRAPLVSFSIEGCADLRDLSRALSDGYGIMCRSGHLCCQPLVDAQSEAEVLRVSAYIYNSVAEVRQVFAALDALVPAFAR